MENVKQLTAKTQTKLNHYLSNFKKHLPKPEIKFIYHIIYGMLKCKHIHLAKISRNLNENITPKKTEERLRYHLKKKELYDKIQKLHLDKNRHRISKCPYIIFDGSDITKEQAEDMEGIDKVRDGSKSASKGKTVIGMGYHWDNVVAVSKDGKEIIPLYSEIYSSELDEEYSISENRKIMKILEKIKPFISSFQIIVFDRGGDRRILILYNLENNQYFIVRLNKNRYLFYHGKARSLAQITRKVKLKATYEVVRNNHNRLEKHVYHVGAVRVHLPTEDLKYPMKYPLWLVVSKEENHGYTWFLCCLPTDNEQEAIELAMRGYQYRWKVEEFHRQIKQDYSLEDIRYQKYYCIKTVASLLLIVMGFISMLDDLFTVLILLSTRLLERNRLSDIPSYRYYRLTEALKIILSRTINYNPFRVKIPKRYEQLTLNLE